MGFVNNQRIVLIQKAILLNFCQQNPIGHQFDVTVRRTTVVKTHFVTDLLTQLCFEFFGNAIRHAAGCNAARLGVTDEPVHATP